MTETIITYLSVALTVFFGYLSIRYAKKSKVLVSLTLKKNECFSLFKTIIKDLKIDVKYKGEITTNPLILFRGTLYNSGTKDISQTSVYKPLKMLISKNYKWLEINIKKKPNNAEVSVKIDTDQILEFGWDLLKKKEYIEFEALLEKIGDSTVMKEDYSMTSEFYDGITFDYRITDLEKIEKQGTSDQKRQSRRRYLITIYILSMIFGVTTFFLDKLDENVLKTGDNYFTIFNLENKNDTSKVSFKMVPLSTKTIILKNDSIQKKISTADFNKTYSVNEIQIFRKTFDYYLIKAMGAVMFLFGLVFLIARPKFDKN